MTRWLTTMKPMLAFTRLTRSSRYVGRAPRHTHTTTLPSPYFLHFYFLSPPPIVSRHSHPNPLFCSDTFSPSHHQALTHNTHPLPVLSPSRRSSHRHVYVYQMQKNVRTTDKERHLLRAFEEEWETSYAGFHTGVVARETALQTRQAKQLDALTDLLAGSGQRGQRIDASSCPFPKSIIAVQRCIRFALNRTIISGGLKN